MLEGKKSQWFQAQQNPADLRYITLNGEALFVFTALYYLFVRSLPKQDPHQSDGLPALEDYSR